MDALNVEQPSDKVNGPVRSLATCIEAEINSGTNTNVTGIEGHMSVHNGAILSP
jgi:hypothetical protein